MQINSKTIEKRGDKVIQKIEIEANGLKRWQLTSHDKQKKTLFRSLHNFRGIAPIYK